MISILVVVAAGVLILLAVGGGADPAVELCPGADDPCKKPYPARTVIEATLEKGTDAILRGIATVKCKEAAVVDKTHEEKGDSLQGEITSLSLTNCSTCASMKSLAIPWKASVKASGDSKGNGILVIYEPRIILSNCTFFHVTCGAVARRIVLDVIGGRPAKALARKERVKLPGGVCGTEGTLTATFEVVQPDPLFVSS